MDTELSPQLPAGAIRQPDDELDAGAGRRPKRAARKVAPSAPAIHPDPHAAERGPYYEEETWSGYLWVAKNGQGTTLTPSTSFGNNTFDRTVCIQGSVAASPDSSGNAMLGMNVDQAQRTDAPPLTLVPSLDGVQADVQNNAGSQLRVQVAAPDGTTNAHARWCAALSGAGGFIPWSAFNTACWDGSGKPYKREPISVAMLLVPGTTHAAVPYDFCLQRLTEAEAPPPGVGAGSAPPDDD